MNAIGTTEVQAGADDAGAAWAKTIFKLIELIFSYKVSRLI